MNDMLALFDDVQPVKRTRTAERHAPRLDPARCCGRTFQTFPGFLGHLSASHRVTR